MQTENSQEIQGEASPSDVVIIPYIDENVALPKNAYDALPSMKNEEEVLLRAQTIKELSDLTGEEIAPDAKNMVDAEQIARDMVENPGKKQEFVKYPNETIAFLAGMVGSMNHMIVKDLADLKLYVVNNLVHIVATTDNAKEKTAALRAIGEVDGVDAFKRKTEVTHKVETMEEVEKELLSMLNDFKKQGLLKPAAETIEAELIEDEEPEEVKEKAFDDIIQEAVNASSSGE